MRPVQVMVKLNDLLMLFMKLFLQTAFSYRQLQNLDSYVPENKKGM